MRFHFTSPSHRSHTRSCIRPCSPPAGTDGSRHVGTSPPRFSETIPIEKVPCARSSLCPAVWFNATVTADPDPEVRIPLAQALPGLEVHPLDPGATPIEAFALIKTLDKDGDVSWAYRTTNRLNREELLGALTVHVALLTKELRDEWIED